MLSVAGINTVRELRIRWIGHTLRAEADVADDLTFLQAHGLAHYADTHLLDRVRRLPPPPPTSPTGAHRPVTGADTAESGPGDR